MCDVVVTLFPTHFRSDQWRRPIFALLVAYQVAIEELNDCFNRRAGIGQPDQEALRIFDDVTAAEQRAAVKYVRPRFRQ
jgi:hypothetical protein